MVKNTCPKLRIPINNNCLQPNSYIKKNKQDFDCCYKLAKSKFPLVQSAKKSPIPKEKVEKVKAPKKEKVEKVPIIYTNFYENLEKLLNEVEKDVNETIKNGEISDEHYEHEVFEITALDKESGSVNNIINILKQKFNPIEVLEKSKNLAVLHYKTIFIGFHTKKSKDEIMVLIGTDATELGISNWFNWDGRFD